VGQIAFFITLFSPRDLLSTLEANFSSRTPPPIQTRIDPHPLTPHHRVQRSFPVKHARNILADGRSHTVLRLIRQRSDMRR
jgi:hypothetical protein